MSLTCTTTRSCCQASLQMIKKVDRARHFLHIPGITQALAAAAIEKNYGATLGQRGVEILHGLFDVMYTLKCLKQEL